jgi:hypothetical protein
MITPISIETLFKEFTHLKGPVRRCIVLPEEDISLLINSQLWKEKLLQHVRIWAPINCFLFKEEKAHRLCVV